MRPYPLFALLLWFFALPAVAQKPPSDTDIERLLRATGTENMVGALIPQVEAAQRQQFEQITAGQELNDAQKQEMDAIQARTSEIVRKALAWEEMKPLYVEIYRRNFSRDEVIAIAKFFESAPGQRLLERKPALMQELTTAIQQKMVPMLEQMGTELKATIAARQEAPMPAPPVSPPQERRPAPARGRRR
jgi:hypothetical protein